MRGFLHICAVAVMPALLVTSGACLFDLGGASGESASLISVDPPQGVGAAPQDIVILGTGLRPLLRQDFSQAQSLQVDASFAAWLGDSELQEVELSQQDQLRAVVPQGLQIGTYDLRVQIPQGETLRLPDAYEVLAGQAISAISPADLINDAAADLIVRGSNFSEPLRVELINDEQHTTSLDLVRVDRQEIVATVPASLPSGGYQVRVQQGQNSFSASQELRIWDPAELGLSVSTSAQVLAMGGQVELRARIYNSGGSTSQQVTIDPPTLSGSATLSHLSGPEPAAVDLAPGASRELVFVYRADGQGEVTVDLRARGLNAFSQRINLSPRARVELAVPRPAQLSAGIQASPTTVAVGANITIAVRVTNTGSGRALAVTPEVVADIPERARIQSGPIPIGAHLAAEQNADFIFTFKALSAGAVSFVASASGTDEASEQPVDAAAVTSTAVHIE